MESKCKTHGSHLLSEVGPTACRCVQCLLQMLLKKAHHILSPSATNYCSRTINFGQHRTIPALRLKHCSGSCGTASALPKCSIMSGCGTRIVLRGQKLLALCDRCPCFGSLFPPLAALTFAASSIICAFGLASAAPRSPYRHLELCGVALSRFFIFCFNILFKNCGSGHYCVPCSVKFTKNSDSISSLLPQ